MERRAAGCLAHRLDSTGLIGTSMPESADIFGTPTGDVATACYDKSVAQEMSGSCRLGAQVRMKEEAELSDNLG